MALIRQNNKNLLPSIQSAGCCGLTLLAMPQIYSGCKLSVNQINILWRVAQVEGYVREDAYVNNVILFARLPIVYDMILSRFPIVLLATKKETKKGLPVMPANAIVLFYQLQIQDGSNEHFILFHADGSLAYNPKPDYMIVGNNTYWYYGFTK